MSGVASFHRTLEQELQALLRRASLECLVCGEFVLHEGTLIRCEECGLRLHGRLTDAAAQLELEAGA